MSGLIGAPRQKSGIANGEQPFRVPRGHFVAMGIGGKSGWHTYQNGARVEIFNGCMNSYLSSRGPAGITGGNNVDGAYDTGSYRYTAKWSGSYFFWIKIYTFHADTHNIIRIWINGVNTGEDHGSSNPHLAMQGDGFLTAYSNNTQDEVPNAMQYVNLNVGDYLELKAGTESTFHGGNSTFGGYMIEGA